MIGELPVIGAHLSRLAPAQSNPSDSDVKRGAEFPSSEAKTEESQDDVATLLRNAIQTPGKDFPLPGQRTQTLHAPSARPSSHCVQMIPRHYQPEHVSAEEEQNRHDSALSIRGKSRRF